MVRLVTKGLCIPHPLKAHFGGEDAHVIDENQQLVVFSDGVGGYDKEIETQVADYSQALVARVAEECKSGASLKKAIHSAHYAVDIPGAATICVVQKEAGSGNRVFIANLGDCRVVVFRNGQAFWSSAVMQHAFNCPLQLGHPLHHPCSDNAESAAFYELELQEGDVLLMGTDGLWDNVWVAELQQLLPTSLQSLEQCAAQMAQLALHHSMDETFISPFAMEAAQHCVGFDRGGKPDDITVLVALVTSDDGAFEQEHVSPCSQHHCTLQVTGTAKACTSADDLTLSAPAPLPKDTDDSISIATIPDPDLHGTHSLLPVNPEMHMVAANAIKHPRPSETETTGPTVSSKQTCATPFQPQVIWCPTFVKGGVVLLAWVELGTAQWLACAQLPNGAYWPVSQNDEAELRWWVAGEPLPLLLGAQGEAGSTQAGDGNSIGQNAATILDFKVPVDNSQEAASWPAEPGNDRDSLNCSVEPQQKLTVGMPGLDLSMGWDCLAQQEDDLAAWNSAVNYKKCSGKQEKHNGGNFLHDGVEAAADVHAGADDSEVLAVMMGESARQAAQSCSQAGLGVDERPKTDEASGWQGGNTTVVGALQLEENGVEPGPEQGNLQDDENVLIADFRQVAVLIETSHGDGGEVIIVKLEVVRTAAENLSSGSAGPAAVQNNTAEGVTQTVPSDVAGPAPSVSSFVCASGNKSVSTLAASALPIESAVAMFHPVLHSCNLTRADSTPSVGNADSNPVAGGCKVQLAVKSCENYLLQVAAVDSASHLNTCAAIGVTMKGSPENSASMLDEPLQGPCEKVASSVHVAAMDGTVEKLADGSTASACEPIRDCTSRSMEATLQAIITNKDPVSKHNDQPLPDDKDIVAMEPAQLTVLGELDINIPTCQHHVSPPKSTEFHMCTCVNAHANVNDDPSGLVCVATACADPVTHLSVIEIGSDMEAELDDGSVTVESAVAPKQYLQAASKLADPFSADMLWGCMPSCGELQVKTHQSAFPAGWQAPEDAIAAHWLSSDADVPLCFGSWTHDEVLHCILSLA